MLLICSHKQTRASCLDKHMDCASNLNFAERVVTVAICFQKLFHCGLGEPSQQLTGQKVKQNKVLQYQTKENLLLQPSNKTNGVAWRRLSLMGRKQKRAS